MARKLRVEYPGAIYHVLNRGDRREAIFMDDTDREHFTEALGEACQKTGWQVHAWCLMANHFHLVVETPQGNLVAGMKWFLGTYTSRFNRRHKVLGHLFSGRYKALVVDGSGTGYLRTVCEYVHLNPVRAGLLRAEELLRAYRWSSFPWYLESVSQRPGWLRVDRVLGEEGILKDSPAGRREFERRLEERRRQEEPEVYAGIRRGWCLGEEAFRQELLERMEGRMGANHYGAERAESQEQKAQRLVAEELRRRKWTEHDLGARNKGDWGKLEIAQRLRQETVMPLSWIAERMQMGCVAYLNNRLYLLRKGKLKK